VATRRPDLPFAECANSPVPVQLVNYYAAQRFTALPHTTVYIDGGARYFPPFTQAISMLEQAGIRNVRGFDASNPRVCRSPRRRRSESGER
jgi:endoglucanase